MRPLPAVRPHVRSQVAGLRERLAARFAEMRPLPRMRPQVRSQGPGLGESASRACARRPTAGPCAQTDPLAFRNYSQVDALGVWYRGTSLIRKQSPLRPYSMPIPRALWCTYAAGVSDERGTPVQTRRL